ncbi:hypothetical protein R50072_15680 [Simiduia litorea]
MNPTTHYLLERKAIQDASQQDGSPFFCQHLVELNQTQKVLAKEDICNKQGAIILKKGEDICEQRAQKIIQHKLIKPIEQSIELSETYNAEKLFNYMKKFGSTVPGLQVVTGSDDYISNLKKMCSYYGKFPLIKQTLTVLANRLHDIYNDSVFTALASLAIAMQMKRSEREQQIIFMAALTHDCGFLYIPNELAHKKQDFTRTQWHSLLAHPIIAKRFLDSVADLPKEVAAAVIDHHERTDGTGYPHQKFGDELSISSQIIGIADDIVTSYKAYAGYDQHTHRMILAALKLNDHLHFEAVFKATAILFQKYPKPQQPPTRGADAQALLNRHQQIQPYFEAIRTLARKVITSTKHPLNRSIASMLGRLAISIVRAGLLQEEHKAWLIEMTVSPKPDELEQLLEVGVMYDQIDNQLLHLKNLLLRVLDDLTPQQGDLKAAAEELFGASEALPSNL